MSDTRTLDHRSRRARAGAVVALVVLVLLLLLLGEGRKSAGRTVGVVLVERVEGLYVEEVEAEQPAEYSGVRPGDRIVSINGLSTPDSRAYDDAARHFRRQEPQRFLVDRRGTTLELRVVPGVSFDWATWVVTAVASALHLALGLLLLLQPVQDERSRLAWILCLAIAVELVLPVQLVGMPMVVLAAECLFWLLTGLQFSVELHLASVLPGARGWFRRSPLPRVFYYGVGLGLGVYMAASWIPALEEVPFFAWPWTDAGALFLSAWFMLWVTGVVLLLGQAAFSWPTAAGRHQALLVLMGVVPWATLTIVVTGLDLRGLPYPTWIDVGQPLILALYPVAVFLAISRYRLFDVELMVRRSLMYTALSTALLLVFYAALGAGTAVLSVLLEGRAPQIWVVGGATLTLGLVFSPLRRWLERTVERRLFPERAALRKRLGDLVRGLPGHGSLESISWSLAAGVADIFAARSVTLLVAERDSDLLVTRASHGVDGPRAQLASRTDSLVEYLFQRRRGMAAKRWPEALRLTEVWRNLGVALAVPLVRGDELTGLLLVGEKESGEAFRAEETELLDLLSTHIATVIENAYLFESATIDGLTGLLRREAVLAELEGEMERAVRYRRPLTVAMADIDRFKRVNDQHGHLAGDMMLRAVAATISSCVRSTDLVGRYGGEEFLLLLPESELDGALAVVEKLREAVEDLEMKSDEGETLSVTISVGVASIARLQGDGELTPRRVIAAVDRSLYDAKDGGRNRVVVVG